MSEHESDSLFEQQLAKRDVITVDAGRTALLETVDLQPPVDSDAKTSDTPVLIAPSVLTAGVPELFAPALQEFWHNGRRALTLEHRYVPGYTGREVFSNESRPLSDLYKLELGRAASLLAVLDKKKVDKADIVGHCEGAINATYLALLRPERVRTLTLVNPAGMGGDSFLRFARLFGAYTARSLAMEGLDMVKGRGAESKKYRPLLHYNSNPLFHPAALYAVSNVRIDTLLDEVEGAGVRVGILQSVNDRFYPPSKSAPYIDTDVISSHQMLDDPKARHSPLIALPEMTVQRILAMQESMLAADK